MNPSSPYKYRHAWTDIYVCIYIYININTFPSVFSVSSTHQKSNTFLLKHEKKIPELFIILSFCGANKGWASLCQTKMRSLHSNTRGIVSAHTHVHTQQFVHLQDWAWAECSGWGLVMEREKEEGGGTSCRAQPSKNFTPVPTQTPALPGPARPPTSGPVTNRAPGSEASAGPWRLLPRHCVMWSVA